MTNLAIDLMTAARATAAAYFEGANLDDISDLNSTLTATIARTKDEVEASDDPTLTLAWTLANDVSDLIDDLTD